jgi:hypothetical protein
MPEQIFENFFNRFFMVIAGAMFFVYATLYNIGYFAVFGNSWWYFFYVPTSIFDIIKTGLIMIVPLAIILLIFKPILINPAFRGIFPGPNILLSMAALVLASNVLHLVIFADSQNKPLSLVLEGSFYLFALMCFMTILYYFLTEVSPQSLMAIFFVSLVPLSYFIGVINAKIDINSTLYSNKSQILLTNDNVVSANILRSFDKGVFVITDSFANSINFITWDSIKEVKFKKIYNF